MSSKIRSVKGKGISIRGNDIDTDRIIPARFMKCVTFAGLGAYAFNDERIDGKGQSKNHPFDNPKWANHPVLLVNANFGCGSSREHAPQALKDYGIRAIVGETFAEIFAGNCSSLGIPAVSLSPKDMRQLQDLVENAPDTEVLIDLESMTVESGGQIWKASMPETYRQAYLSGDWDTVMVLAGAMGEIERVAAELPYM